MKLSVFVIFCCVALTAAHATAYAAADLLTLYRDAQMQDTVYLGARATYEAGQEKLPQARAGLLPAINLSGDTEYNNRDLRFRGTSVGTNENYNTNNLNVTAKQPLFRMQEWITYKQAQFQVSLSKAVYLQAQQDLIVRLVQAYFDVLLAEYTVTLATAQKAAYSEQYSQARRNFELGNATVTDANDAQARRDLAASQEIAAQNEVALKQEALRQIIGRAPPDLARLNPRFAPALPNPASMDAWVEEALRTSFEVRIAQAGLDVAMQEVDKTRSAHLPTVDAVASYTDTGSGAGLQLGPGYDSKTKYIGLQLAFPIYLGGGPTSRTREARAGEEKARQDLERSKRTAAFNTRTAYLGTTSAIAQIGALQAAIASTESSLASSRLGRDVGVRTEVDVLNATQQVLATRRDYAQAIYAYTINALKLKAAAGTLNPDDVAYVNQWLEP